MDGFMKWTCKKIPLYIDHYLEGWLSRRDRLAYKAHVETCPGCRGYFGREAASPDGITRWSCRTVELFLDDYLEEKLSAEDEFTYEAHLETCPSCREYVDGMSAFIEKVHGEIGPRIRARERQVAPKMPQKVSDQLARLPIEKQFLLAEAVGRDVEEEDRRWEEWMERARKRRERAKPN
jgi:predicted anti-sigma-YlaC factor YlaD